MKRTVGISLIIVMAAAGCSSGGSDAEPLAATATSEPLAATATSEPLAATATSEPLVTAETILIDTTATPPAAPIATYAVVEGEIDTPAEAAQALVDAGVTCDLYQDEPPPSGQPPKLPGFCESGDSVIFISVWQGDAATIMDSLLTSTDLINNYKTSGRTEANSVISGHNSYGVAPLDRIFRNGGVPTDAERQLLDQIVEATGGELKTWNY